MKASHSPFSKLPDILHAAGVKLKSGGTESINEKAVAVSSLFPASAASQFPPDDEIFWAAMNGVQRITWKHSPEPKLPIDIRSQKNPEIDDRRLMQAAIDGHLPMSISNHPEYIEGWVGHTGKKLLVNLRNGLYSIHGQLDLHALNRNEAKTVVEDYIKRMARFRPCCIKIIHGRGINSEKGAPLKEALQKLLATRKMSRYVVAYASAKYCDGGVGAVYVLLRRP